MADISSLIRRCLVVLGILCYFVPGASWAVGDWPKSSIATWTGSYGEVCARDNPNGSSACEFSRYMASLSGYSVVSPPSCVIAPSGDTATCTWKVRWCHPDDSTYCNPVVTTNGTYTARFSEACPATTVASGNRCTCPAGEAVNAAGTGCVADCNKRVVQFQHEAGGTGQWQLPAPVNGGINTGSVCAGGCEARFGFRSLGYDGKTYGSQMYATGSTCTPGDGGMDAPVPGDAPKEGEVPNTCKAPLCPGQVNGATVCVPCSTTTQEKTEKTNSDGTKTETKTECSGGMCTTTETTKDAAGVEKGKTTTIEPLGSICSRFPNSGHCTGLTNNGSGGPAGGSGGSGGSGSGNGSGGEEVASSFNGTCAQRFVCTGDAIQCAIAKDQHIRACQFYEDQTPLSLLGEAAANGEAIPDGHPGKNPESKDFNLSGLISQDGNGLAGGCPADISFSVMGSPAVIPLSSTCDSLHMVGQIAVAIAMIAAAFIVFRT